MHPVLSSRTHRIDPKTITYNRYKELELAVDFWRDIGEVFDQLLKNDSEAIKAIHLIPPPGVTEYCFYQTYDQIIKRPRREVINVMKRIVKLQHAFAAHKLQGKSLTRLLICRQIQHDASMHVVLNRGLEKEFLRLEAQYVEDNSKLSI